MKNLLPLPITVILLGVACSTASASSEIEESMATVREMVKLPWPNRDAVNNRLISEVTRVFEQMMASDARGFEFGRSCQSSYQDDPHTVSLHYAEWHGEWNKEIVYSVDPLRRVNIDINQRYGDYCLQLNAIFKAFEQVDQDWITIKYSPVGGIQNFEPFQYTFEKK